MTTGIIMVRGKQQLSSCDVRRLDAQKNPGWKMMQHERPWLLTAGLTASVSWQKTHPAENTRFSEGSIRIPAHYQKAAFIYKRSCWTGHMSCLVLPCPDGTDQRRGQVRDLCKAEGTWTQQRWRSLVLSAERPRVCTWRCRHGSTGSSVGRPPALRRPRLGCIILENAYVTSLCLAFLKRVIIKSQCYSTVCKYKHYKSARNKYLYECMCLCVFIYLYISQVVHIYINIEIQINILLSSNVLPEIGSKNVLTNLHHGWE